MRSIQKDTWARAVTLIPSCALFALVLTAHSTSAQTPAAGTQASGLAAQAPVPAAQTPVPGTHAPAPGAQTPSAAVLAQPEYHPSLGDLMTMAVQPRHIKLGIAGKQKNWAYAKYELSELRNAFGRVARTIPVYRNADLGALMNALTTDPLKQVEQAITAADAAKFQAAYAKLTATCNACHLSQDHAMVVIRVPDAAAFPDQDFRVPR